METLLVENQQDIFAGAFYGAIIFFAIIEFLIPRFKARHGVGRRWSTNISLAGINLLIASMVIPFSSMVLAIQAQEHGWGLMNLTAPPLWLALLLSVLLLDLVKYWEHRLLHHVPVLWRLHVVHHADLDIDFTTGFRHHPFEVLLASFGVPLAVLAAGMPPVAVLIFHLLATVSAVYTHANIRYPDWLDNTLRTVLMTRYAHLVHHSAWREETDSNFGLIFLFWDRLFGTYRARPQAGLEDMVVGVEYFRTPRDLVIDQVMTMPFRVPRNPPRSVSTDNSGDSLPEPRVP